MKLLKLEQSFQFFIILIVALVFSSCDNSERTENSVAQDDNVTQDEASVVDASTLEIIEDDVPLQNIAENPFENLDAMREDPIIDPDAPVEPETKREDNIVNPDVNFIGKLSKGTKAKILQRTSYYEQVEDYADYWYEIELEDGTRGWVYGKQTSVNLGENKQSTKVIFDGGYPGTDITPNPYFYCHAVDGEKDSGVGFDGSPYDVGNWNFSQAHELNNYGKYDLIKDTKKYEGKTFEVTWKMKMIKVKEDITQQEPTILELKLLD